MDNKEAKDNLLKWLVNNPIRGNLAKKRFNCI